LRGESAIGGGGTILGPDGRVISRVPFGSVMRGAEEAAPAVSRVLKFGRYLQLIVDGVTAFTFGAPLAVPAAYAAAGGIGLAGLLGPQYYAWKKYTTPSANADPGTPGYTAWQAHLSRALQHKNTHMSAHDALYGGLAIDLARIHARATLLQPNVGINALHLPTMPAPAQFAVWNKAQMAAAALATKNGYGGPTQFDTYARDATASLHSAAEELHKPLPPQTIEVVLKLPNGMTIGHAEAIVQRSMSERSQARSRGTVQTSPFEPAALSALNPFLPVQ
jgi:hypothetical protein